MSERQKIRCGWAGSDPLYIAYHDREGNLTRFEIGGYQGLPRQGQFSPPGEIKWED